MKSLKFNPESVKNILSGEKSKTWRIFDDKQLEIDDELQLVNSDTGEIFGYARIKSVAIKHVKDIDSHDMEGNKYYGSVAEIVADFRKYNGPSVDENSLIKVLELIFLGQKLPACDVENTTPITEVKLYTDGGSRGNPGPSACGIVILDMNDNVIKTDGGYLGITTNNQAEYQAVRQGLKLAEQIGAKTVHVFMDSLLVVNQMTGIFKIKNRDLWPIHQEITEQMCRFKKVSFTHVPREMNKLADRMVNETLDNQQNNGLVSELL